MPRFFFHLNFGQRVVPDEEGVELPNRSAAREEALAVVRELANPEVGGNARRWASWFLQVADERGPFFRTPIGHPALEVVAADAQEPHAERRALTPIPATAVAQQGPTPRARRDLVHQIWALRQHTAQLMAHNQQLREELSLLHSWTEGVRRRARHAVELARCMGTGGYK
jgi:hypothetical protein